MAEYTLPALPYAYNALEPHIDAKTMEIHHTKHHQTYITNLNNAIKDTDLGNQSVCDLCKNLGSDQEPSCVVACPHGAAIRVANPREFFAARLGEETAGRR